MRLILKWVQAQWDCREVKWLKVVEFCDDEDELLGSIPVTNFFTISVTAMWQMKTSYYEKVHCSFLFPKCLKFHISCVSYLMFTKRILAVTGNKMFLLVCAGRHTYFELHLKQGTKFFTLMPDIFLVLGNGNMLQIIILVPRNMKWLLNFWIIFLTLDLKYRVPCVFMVCHSPSRDGRIVPWSRSQPTPIS